MFVGSTSEMTCSLKESFERSCRLCAEEQEVTIMIFSKEAEALLLQNKLIQYLLIEVDQNDTLPKNICIRCCTKLHTVCDFIDTARKSQEILLSRSVLLSQMNVEEPCELAYIKTEPVEQDTYFDKEAKITQMEISIDPMLILQNCDGYDLTPDSEEPPAPACGEQLAYLHGLENENVTIKLIRKCDSSEVHREDAVDPKRNEAIDNFKPFPCVVCKRSFLTELALKNHSWIHYNEDRSNKQFCCNACKDSFDYKSDLLAHLKEHKSNVTCKVCGRVSAENLALHLESHSTPSQAYTCKICGRAYNTSSNLKTHSITHSNERPYQCHICKKSFKRNQDLKFHINQHTGARPYKCPYCEKCFASSGNCYSHRNRMHPGKKEALGNYRPASLPVKRARRIAPKLEVELLAIQTNGQSAALPTFRPTAKPLTKYKCQICGHGFMKKDNFTYHMYQHTGEKPFQCSFCPEKFVTRRGLTIHHDRSHPHVDRPLSLLTKNMLLS